MGAEATLWHPPRQPRTPSRLSNCGEMVSESVLEQLEMELRLESDAFLSESRIPSPGGCKLLVGMKLNATCREMLAWTILDLAKPGDHIIAFHVSAFPIHSVTTAREGEEHFEQLANTLRGFLTIYEGLCILKKIKLEVEILPGIQVKKVLVDFAKSHRTCKLILGSNKHFTARRNKSLGRYCLKRLPYTCSVVILQHGEIILNENGKLSRSDFTRIGAGVIRTLRRSMKSFGRSKKVRSDESFDGLDTLPRESEASHFTYLESMGYTEHSAELEKCYFSDSSLFHSSLFRELSFAPSPQTETQRSDMFLLEDHNGSDILSTESESPTSFEDLVIPGWPLMHHTIGFDKVKPVLECFSPEKELALVPHRGSSEKVKPSPRPSPCYSVEKRSPTPSPIHRLSVEKSTETPEEKLPRPRSPLRRLSVEKLSPSALQRRFSDKVKKGSSPIRGLLQKSPIANRHDFEPSQIATIPNRHMSVVDWALQLPHRSGEFKQDYAEVLGEIARDAFISASAGTSGSEDSFRVNKKVKFSLEMPEESWSSNGKNLSLAQQLELLCLDLKCTVFDYEDLKAATSNFDSSNVVGHGGGSEVYKGMMADGKLVAVKRLSCGPQAEEELLNDVAINTSLSRHPHIVTLLGYCVDFSHLILVYKYLPEGNLEDRLHATGLKTPVLPWRVRYKVAVGIAKALDYLHHGSSRPVIHRDVKASNILLTADFESQLSDFGLAKWAPKEASHLLCDDILGTFGYLAPEYFMYGRVNNKTDVYAFGVVLLELITGRTPIDNSKPKGHENLVNWARPLLKDNNLSELVDPRLEGAYDVEQMKRLLLAASLCVRQSSQRRPQMGRVLQILCSNHNKLQLIRARKNVTLEREDSSSVDLEESEVSISETPSFNGCSSTDIKTHFALAMLGVDDSNNVNSRNSLDHRGVDRLHSSKYLEAYLEGRYSSSSSLVK